MNYVSINNEEPAFGPSPSHQEQKNFALFNEQIEADAAFDFGFSRDAMSIDVHERPATMTAKIILPQYLHQKNLMGITERKGVRGIVTTVDFVVDVEICARRALKRKPQLLLAFVTLFQREDGERVNDYAKTAPRSFDMLLRLLGAELRRRQVRITSLGAYLNRPSPERAR
jgi:hypothetical protein